MEAILRILTKNPTITKRALEVDSDGSGNLNTRLNTEGDWLNVEIKADRLSNLRAGINTTLRLVKTSNSAIRI